MSKIIKGVSLCMLTAALAFAPQEPVSAVYVSSSTVSSSDFTAPKLLSREQEERLLQRLQKTLDLIDIVSNPTITISTQEDKRVATINLTLDAGASLSPETYQGIKNLVSCGLGDIAVEDVYIVENVGA